MKIMKLVYKRYWKVLIPAVVTLIILLGAMFFESKDVFGYLTVDDEIKNVLDDYFKQRCSALITGDITPVKGQFDLSSVYGKWSYEHEVKRIKFARDWSLVRELTFRECETKLKIFSIKGGSNSVKLYLSDRTRMSYTYNDDESGTLNEFCIGTTHSLNLVKKNNSWYVTVDWYEDPLEDTIALPKSIPTSTTEGETYEYGWLKYNRSKAVEYADKYCGANFYIEDGYKYNRKYRNFAVQGGDCANFVSQALSDKEAGGIRMGSGWLYKGGEASASWVNAGAFTKNMINSGRAKLISRGKYEKIVNYTKYISPGDIISYEKDGDIVHVSIVTAIDSMGVPLVNSHTNDRYHVPWDLGWNSGNVNFWLLKING
jgi:hypothetical protein